MYSDDEKQMVAKLHEKMESIKNLLDGDENASKANFGPNKVVIVCPEVHRLSETCAYGCLREFVMRDV
jgi:hypothetical protein